MTPRPMHLNNALHSALAKQHNSPDALYNTLHCTVYCTLHSALVGALFGALAGKTAQTKVDEPT